jgi:hypothetical protein
VPSGNVTVIGCCSSRCASASYRAAAPPENGQRLPRASQRRKNSFSVACAPTSLCSRVENGSVAASPPRPVDDAIGSRTPSTTIARTRLGNMFA